MTSPQTGAIQFESKDYNTSEYAGSVSITVVRTSGDTGSSFNGNLDALSVEYRTEDGTARAGTDYQPVSGTLTWANNDRTPKEFIVPIYNDATAEATETVTLLLDKPAENSWLNSVESALLTIEDNDGGGGGSSGGCFIGSLGSLR
jgi:hypothetical protein